MKDNGYIKWVSKIFYSIPFRDLLNSVNNIYVTEDDFCISNFSHDKLFLGSQSTFEIWDKLSCDKIFWIL